MTEAPPVLAATPDLSTREHGATQPGRHRCAGHRRRCSRSALEQLRLEGAIFFRSELTEPLRVRVDAAARWPTRCTPGAERLILFHIVARGLVLGLGRRRRAPLGRARAT